MKKEVFNTERYIYSYKGKKYYIYLFPNETDNNYTDFYIQNKENDKFVFEIGINTTDLKYSVEKFIKNNIKNWIDDIKEKDVDDSIL